MKWVALDLSTNTGVALFDDTRPEFLVKYYEFSKESPLSTNIRDKKPTEKLKSKRIRKGRRLKGYDPANHPKDFLGFVDDYIDDLIIKIRDQNWWADSAYLVIEQTNKGRDRWKQKLLEWLHFDLCKKMGYKHFQICYIDTLEWREILKIKVSKEERRNNRKIRKHNKEAKEDSEIKRITGLINSKTLAIDYCNAKFNLKLKRKDHNIADAICIGWAFYLKSKGEKNGNII